MVEGSWKQEDHILLSNSLMYCNLDLNYLVLWQHRHSHEMHIQSTLGTPVKHMVQIAFEISDCCWNLAILINPMEGEMAMVFNRSGNLHRS